MNDIEFQELLSSIKKTLEHEARTKPFKTSSHFEDRTREVISDYLLSNKLDLSVDFNSHLQAFPDICLGRYGIEVKFTEKDTWRGVSNSISQAMKEDQVEEIWVIWCKQGGKPEILFRRYEDVVTHVRTSHVPRFEIDMTTNQSLFGTFRISYTEFSELDMLEKMDFVRRYVRNRKRNGLKQKFWFLETQDIDSGIDTSVKLFSSLDLTTKKELAFIELILFPEILNNDFIAYQYDTRCLHLFYKNRILYPQVFRLIDDVIPGFSSTEKLNYISNDLDLFNQTLQRIPVNWLREYSEWWDSQTINDISVWYAKVKQLLT